MIHTSPPALLTWKCRAMTEIYALFHVQVWPTGQIANKDLVLKWGPNEDYFTEKVLMGTMRTRSKALNLQVQLYRSRSSTWHLLAKLGGWWGRSWAWAGPGPCPWSDRRTWLPLSPTPYLLPLPLASLLVRLLVYLQGVSGYLGGTRSHHQLW